MKPAAEISRDGKSLTVRVPLTFRARGSRKVVIVPEGAQAWSPYPQKPSNAILKALGRAWRWKQMIETGEFATVAELAKAEGVNFSYLCRVLRLTFLSPAIVETLLNGRQKSDLTIDKLLKPQPHAWAEQEKALL